MKMLSGTMDIKSNVKVKPVPSINPNIKDIDSLIEKKAVLRPIKKDVSISKELSKYVSSYRTWGETLKNY